ncbi:MAG TPA: (2Fe-2S)-binding protein [Armatimonadota bacterium]|nr:(2Fe-2S)-binding protein [Armatimonadota bacterium]
MKQLITLRVNGQSYPVEVEPRERLLDVVRYKLDLTGAKEGCGTGDCGACTMLIDGKPVTTCLVLAVTAADREITTVEGLARPGELSALQQAFVEKTALQCGVCIPGFLVNATALLRENPDPTEEEVRYWLQGNLCRCTGYSKIFEAVLEAARKATPAAPGESA